MRVLRLLFIGRWSPDVGRWVFALYFSVDFSLFGLWGMLITALAVHLTPLEDSTAKLLYLKEFVCLFVFT